MDSPLIQRLKKALADATDPVVRAIHKAEIGNIYARAGEDKEAEQILSDLRAEYGDGRNLRVSVKIMMLEAQRIYYRDLGRESRDRMMRAQLLSVAARDADLTASSSAWLAHFDFNFQKHKEMTRNLRMAFDTIRKDDSLSAVRLALTLGDANLASEDIANGKQWYSKAHQHAVTLGDHTAIAALTYNKASLSALVSRLCDARGKGSELDARTVAGEIASAENYQAIAGLSSLQPLLVHAKSSFQIFKKDYASALVGLEELLAKSITLSPVGNHLYMRADVALCLAGVGRAEESRILLDSFPIEEVSELQADDRLLCYASIKAAAKELGHQLLMDQVEPALLTAIQAYESDRQELAMLIAPFNSVAMLEKL